MATVDELTTGKPALQSKTIWGNIISILGTVASGYVIVSTGIPIDVAVPALGAAVAAVAGNVMSILGRIAATKKINVPEES